MLFALVEEMGHEYNFMPDGVTSSRNVKARPSILVPGIFGDAASEYEVSDEVEDSDDGKALISV